LATMWLFSYGTLRQPEVQLPTFGRLLHGHADELVGYAMTHLKITDEHVVALSGSAEHPLVRFTGNVRDRVAGMAFAVDASGLAKADQYEVAAYRRVAVDLASGKSAYLYVAAEP
jgi:gamma-glutamylcyclotransferase (GGCT)/AIG2-like uncharacterized protein YtfP